MIRFLTKEDDLQMLLAGKRVCVEAVWDIEELFMLFVEKVPREDFPLYLSPDIFIVLFQYSGTYYWDRLLQKELSYAS